MRKFTSSSARRPIYNSCNSLAEVSWSLELEQAIVLNCLTSPTKSRAYQDMTLQTSPSCHFASSHDLMMTRYSPA